MNYYKSAFPVYSSSDGIAYEIYLAGCKGYCEGCHTPHTWDFKAGVLMSEIQDKLIADMGKVSHQFDNIVIMGGEPLDHGEELELFLEKLDSEFPDKNIYLYTHFEIGEIGKNVFKWVNYIKCGKYMGHLPNDKPDPLVNVTLASSNQYFVKGDRKNELR